MTKSNSISLATQMSSGGNPIYDDETFRYVLMNHLPNFMSKDDTTLYQVEQAIASQYYGDFYGLLGHLDVPTYIHWLTAQLNGYDCSTDFDADRLELIIPGVTYITRLRNLHTSVNGIVA